MTTTTAVTVHGPAVERSDEILTPDALELVAALQRRFGARRDELLAARTARREEVARTGRLDFLPETADVRAGDWTVAGAPADLQDRRVEITGPPTPKMAINALNSGAKVWLADLEDASTPHWSNVVGGQVALRDATRRALAFTSPEGKQYALRPEADGDPLAVMVVRPRGWHFDEVHLDVDGTPAVGALVDFGLHFFHNAAELLARGSGPYYYLPKMESHLEARLWDEVFTAAQEALGIPHGTIRATVLIETIPAAFEMDEILYELRDHMAGLNCGRWDYIFSFIKKLARNKAYVLPDRSQVVMSKAFLRAYSLLLIQTCHKRGAFAMGGMAAQIPVKNNPEANAAAFAKVKADKEREAGDGHDGTWVAHPDLVPVANEVFDRLMPQANQLDRLREDVQVGAKDLLEIHEGTRSEEGFRENIRVGVQYLEAWLRGRGAVPIYNMMEDAATAEISRAQIWQFVSYGVAVDGGNKVTPDLFKRCLAEEMERVKGEVGAENYDKGRFPEAIDLFSKLSLAPEFEDFLTVPAYGKL